MVYLLYSFPNLPAQGGAQREIVSPKTYSTFVFTDFPDFPDSLFNISPSPSKR